MKTLSRHLFTYLELETILFIVLNQISAAALWKHKRKEYQPFFVKNNLLGVIQEMNRLNDKYILNIKEKVDGPEFDLGHYMNNLSFDTIMST